MAAKEFFSSITEKYDEVKPTKMFGCDCVKTPNGKAAAMFWHDWLVVKLNNIDTNLALKINGAKVFEPMEGRPMNGWVQIPFSAKRDWDTYLKKSIELVKAIPAKRPKPKKK